MTLFVCAIFTFAALYYVFFLPGEVYAGEEKTRLGYLRERKEAVYENLRDLNFEYKAGKVPDTDYQSLRTSLEDEAAAIMAEIARLVVACGGRLDTIAGLAGLGALVLTCTGDLSRNRSVGVELGRGRKLSDIIDGMHGAVAEGVFTTKAAVGLARKRNVEMPITEQMFAILEQGKSPQRAIEELMTRAARSEV